MIYTYTLYMMYKVCINIYLKYTHICVSYYYISGFSYFTIDYYACPVFPTLSTFLTDYFNFEEGKRGLNIF